VEVELDRIKPNPFQPRKSMDPAGLEELRDSISSHGILQPIVLRSTRGEFELIAGERRWRAAGLAGLERIPALVREGVSDGDMLELALVENVQRRDLNPIERAEGFRAIMQSLSITQEGVAAKVGLKRATVANHLRLLELPEEIQAAVGRGLVSMGHARALLALPSGEKMAGFLEQIVRDELSVREVGRRVREELATIRSPQASGKNGGAAPGPQAPAKPWIADLERKIRENLGTKTTIHHGPGMTGRIVIEYYTRESLERVCEILAPRPTV